MQHWLIGYGSLMDRASAERTLGAGLSMLPVVLDSWRRDFGLAISRSANYRCRVCLGGTEGIAAADAQPSEGSQLAAVAIRVDLLQLQDADQRETSYRRVALPSSASSLPGTSWIYQGLSKHRLGASVVPAEYWALIAAAAKGHPAGKLILQDRPSLPLADLEFVRYQEAEPLGQCECWQSGSGSNYPWFCVS